MSSLVIGTAPEGLDLSANRIAQNDGTVAAVMAIATVFVGLRFWARTTNKSADLAYDDWFVLVALVCLLKTLIKLTKSVLRGRIWYRETYTGGGRK
ncbi:hypothetical protein AO1008_09912 [Aspergillus oryzae 100-8]|uniref:Uncharacterized protein n=1 Tax=Aspergillus oryzae (strain 3.042) TaxID=1160506 RepID=I8U4M6_ASPO3|nr:hypothetical protein Ao3042_01812 [Aspergillus oryzae 3.042]KDE83425.1 hypothetical protein AO1008_09912 [Aspergillus oryzae 100-8]|eukprot:EIT81678.1 hypothetical protein Ao3042_01812 [Aspergillus oryzae 3.042]